MDARINQIGEEAGPHVTLKELYEKRKELEKVPPPMRENKFEQWKKDREKQLKDEMIRVARTPVQRAAADIASIWSAEKLLELTEVNFMKEQVKVMWPAVALMYLDLLVESLETAVYSHEKGGFDSRFQSIDAGIQRMSSMIPKPFDPSMINVDKRFPIDRIGWEKDRAYDKWLTDGLKSKPIFFEPRDQYIDALCRYYHEVYWATAEKEKAEKQEQAKKVEELKANPPPPPSDEISPSALREFYDMGRQSNELSQPGHVSRIYKGGKR